MTTEFSAVYSALGYFYQVRYALYLILSAIDENTELYVEALDDIDLRVDGTSVEVLQLKHHNLKRLGNLTDTSPDFWKTIRIWSSLLKENKITSSVIFTLVTTQRVPDTSLLANFLKSPRADVQTIVDKLLEISNTSHNSELEAAFDAFNTLSDVQRKQLINGIRIIDNQPTISDLNNLLYSHLPAPKDIQIHLLNALEGWWFNRVIQQMKDQPLPIYKGEVNNQIWNIQNQYREDSLPTEFWADIPIPSLEDVDHMTFIWQLIQIALKKPQINKAIKDYFHAFEQRSRWQRENLLLPNELEKYENKLVDEWERYVSWQVFDRDNDDILLQVGQNIYRWVEDAKNHPKIRDRVDEPYIIRGSYHILANKQMPRVWWHPLFLERLQSLIELATPSSAWESRTTEVANLMNPAFCALLLRDAVKEYQVKHSLGMPYALVYLILPIVLHRATRLALPRSRSTKMSPWLLENQQVLVNFPERVRSLKQITNEAIIFGGSKGVMKQSDALFTTTNKTFKKDKKLKERLANLDDNEVLEIQKSAAFIGKWLSDNDSFTAIYNMWGIKP